MVMGTLQCLTGSLVCFFEAGASKRPLPHWGFRCSWALLGQCFSWFIACAKRTHRDNGDAREFSLAPFSLIARRLVDFAGPRVHKQAAQAIRASKQARVVGSGSGIYRFHVRASVASLVRVLWSKLSSVDLVHGNFEVKSCTCTASWKFRSPIRQCTCSRGAVLGDHSFVCRCSFVGSNTRVDQHCQYLSCRRMC